MGSKHQFPHREVFLRFSGLEAKSPAAAQHRPSKLHLVDGTNKGSMVRALLIPIFNFLVLNIIKRLFSVLKLEMN